MLSTKAVPAVAAIVTTATLSTLDGSWVNLLSTELHEYITGGL